MLTLQPARWIGEASHQELLQMVSIGGAKFRSFVDVEISTHPQRPVGSQLAADAAAH